METIEAAKNRLGEEGRVVVRYSGTEMKLRVMVEGMDDALVAACAEEIAESARQEIGGE